MLDLFFLIGSIVIASLTIVFAAWTVFRAWGSPPRDVRLVPINNSVPAHTIDLEPYVENLSEQFSKTLGIENNE